MAMAPMLATLRREAEALSQRRHTIVVQDEANVDLSGSNKELHSAFSNLVSNAVRYTPAGGHIRVGWHQRGAVVEYTVEDDGIGIAPEHIEAIFDEYFQIGNLQRDRAKGLGLGLSIVRRLAKTLGCQVSCRSRPGKGSVFEFQVPLLDESIR